MNRTGALTKALAGAGAVLAWLPIAVTIIFSFLRTIATGVFHCDYLMPAEMFPFAFGGAALLLWAALRARLRRKLIGWGIGVMLAMLIGGQALAVITGLADGTTEPVGMPWLMVVTALAGYTLALLELGCAGVLLLRDLFRGSKDSSSPRTPDPERFLPSRST